jgi:hypothetical protein
VCQGEGGGEALVAVFVGEDGKQDAVHGGLVLWKVPMGRVRRLISPLTRSRGLVTGMMPMAAAGEDRLIIAYGVTIRAAGRWEHEAWAGRCVR